MNGARCIKEIQEGVGGSYATIYKRIEELARLSVIGAVPLDGTEFSHLAPNARLFKLTEAGEAIVGELSKVGLIKQPTLSKQRQRWILLHLFLFEGVKGRTRFEKLLYLQKEELRFVKGNFYSFRWLHYGPYSEELMHDLDELRDGNLISVEVKEVDVKSNVAHLFIYRLTSKGKELIPSILTELPVGTLEKLEKLKPFQEMPLEKLMEYVYKKFGKRT